MKNIKKTITTVLCVIIMLGIAPLNGFVGVDFPDINISKLNIHLPEFRLPDFGTLFATEASAASSGTCGDSVTWNLDDSGTFTLSGSGEMSNYSANGTPWNDVKESIKSVVIESGVTVIGKNAFNNCSNLLRVTVPASVNTVYEDAFKECSSLTRVDISDLASWCKIRFLYNTSNPVYYAHNLYLNGELLTDLVIPDGITRLGGNLFNNCTSLVNVSIPGSVTYVGGFTDCTGLKNVTMDYGVETIGVNAFLGCSSLTGITIPDSVTSIEWSAFQSCTDLASVTIGSNVNSIGFSAFSGCKSLTNLVIPDSVKTIDNFAFLSCAGLTSVYLGNGVTNIGLSSFAGCTNLTGITIPDSVTSIGEDAFFGCHKLTALTLGDGITSIGTVFMECPLENVKMGRGFTSIPKSIVKHETLKSFLIGESVTSIDISTFGGCSSLIDITIPESVTSIGETAFAGCSSLTEITIPGSVTSIGKEAFGRCTGLTRINIPDGVTSIGDYTFASCTGLTSVTIPESVTSIGKWAFYNCTGLTEINYNAKNVADLTSSSDAFYNAGTSGGGIAVTFGDSVERIPAYLFRNSYTSSRPKITSIALGNGVKSIGSYAFPGCTGLTSITIPGSVTSIGNGAFSGCTGLTNVTIPDGVTSIGEDAFYNCTGLTSITIPSSVTSIGSYAFYNVNNIIYNGTASGSPWWAKCVNGYVEGNLVYKDSSMKELVGCSSATTGIIIIPDSVTSVGNNAFYTCSGLTRVTIGNSVTNIGNYAFSGCTGLTEIAIPDSVTRIGEYSFSVCNNPALTYIVLGNSNISIEKYAFSECDSITDVYYAGTEEQRSTYVITDYGNNRLINATWHYESRGPEEELIKAKGQAKTEVDNEVPANPSDRLIQIANEVKQAIDNANSISAVETAKQNGIAAIRNQIRTELDEAAAQELANAKSMAKAAIDALANGKSDAVKAIADTAKRNIDNAKTVNEVNEAMQNGIEAINAKVQEEQDAQAGDDTAVKALADAKVAAIREIERTVDSKCSDRAINLAEDAKEAVNNAKTVQEVNEKKDAGIKAVKNQRYNDCNHCGCDHSKDGFFGFIIRFFHSILAMFGQKYL